MKPQELSLRDRACQGFAVLSPSDPPLSPTCRWSKRALGLTELGKRLVVLWGVIVALSCSVNATAAEPQTSISSVNRALRRRLLRGSKETQLKSIQAVRQHRREDPAALAALIECADRVLQEDLPDTRVGLIVETLGVAPPTDATRAALLRWLDQALEPPPDTIPPEWQMLAHAVLVALRGDPHEDVQQRACQLLDNEDLRLKMLAVDILGCNAYAPALEKLIELLESPSFQADYAFRYSLLDALTRYPQVEAQESLRRVSSRLDGQLNRLLSLHFATTDGQLPRALTIANRPLRARESSRDEVHQTFRYLTTRAPVYAAEERQRTYGVPQFMGVPLYASRITFVIDVSSSMGQPLGGFRTRLDAAKHELQQAIQQLPENNEFRVIGFGTNVVSLSPTLVRSTPVNKDLLNRQLDYLIPATGTNLYGGLRAALMDPGQPELVILLSDGKPTAGEFRREDEILKVVGYANLFRRITIVTVSIGSSSSLMQQLALQNGGSHRRVN